MFKVSFCNFMSRDTFNSYEITFMPGLSIEDILNKNVYCMVNPDTKVAYVYYD